MYLQHMLLKIRRKTIGKFTFSKYHVHCLMIPLLNIPIVCTNKLCSCKKLFICGGGGGGSGGGSGGYLSRQETRWNC